MRMQNGEPNPTGTRTGFGLRDFFSDQNPFYVLMAASLEIFGGAFFCARLGLGAVRLPDFCAACFCTGLAANADEANCELFSTGLEYGKRPAGQRRDAVVQTRDAISGLAPTVGWCALTGSASPFSTAEHAGFAKATGSRACLRRERSLVDRPRTRRPDALCRREVPNARRS